MRKKKILVIDDEASVTRMVKVNLELAGPYEVKPENDPRHALAAAHEFEPDLILLDVMMPQMDGGEVANLIRSDPRLKHVPIVFLTAIVSKKETGGHEMVTSSGMFVAKPVSLKDLLECIENELK
jgi:CheY-like chemotaxis protein